MVVTAAYEAEVARGGGYGPIGVKIIAGMSRGRPDLSRYIGGVVGCRQNKFRWPENVTGMGEGGGRLV